MIQIEHDTGDLKREARDLVKAIYDAPEPAAAGPSLARLREFMIWRLARFCPCCIGCVFGKSARGAVSLGEVGVEGSCDMNGSRCRVESLARFRGQLYELSAAGDKQCLIVRHSPSAGRGQRGGGNERRVEAPPHAPRQRP